MQEVCGVHLKHIFLIEILRIEAMHNVCIEIRRCFRLMEGGQTTRALILLL